MSSLFDRLKVFAEVFEKECQLQAWPLRFFWAYEELTLEVPREHLKTVAEFLRTTHQFETLLDISGIDYLTYGESEWATEQATGQGFSRGVDRADPQWVSEFLTQAEQPAKLNVEMNAKGFPARYAVAYHLLSIAQNLRLRLKVFLETQPPVVDSVVSIWPSANWYEREAFDLFGILFQDHPDLRRLLTDYGFIGHPFRKDFPISGYVEVRYDAEAKRVIYQPVSIEPRVLVPRVVRDDHRYLDKK